MLRTLIVFILFNFSTELVFSQNCTQSTIHFRSNKLLLKKKHVEHIDSVLNSLSLDTNYLIELHGHTDDKKSEEYNWKLGHLRAESVSKYIKSKRQDLVIIQRSFGETEPVSKRDSKNRRVQIFTTPINADSTVTIYGDFHEQMKLNYRYFNRCGYCLTNPKITSTRPAGYYKTDRDIHVSIELECETDIKCYSVEYRFPYSYFNNTDSIMIPKPLYVLGNCGSKRKNRDSVDVKEDENFEISYDTITNEYVIRHDCYQPHHNGICCGTRNWPCAEHRLHFYKRQKTLYNAVSISRYNGDTLIRLEDSLYLEPKECFSRFDTLYSIAKYESKLLFYQSAFNKMVSDTSFDSKGFRALWIDNHIPIEEYKPLTYSEANIKVKVHRKALINSLGYYLPNYDHYIELNRKRRRKRVYEAKFLEFPFVFGGLTSEGVHSFYANKTKKRFRKRRNQYKYKIKRKRIDDVKYEL